MNSDLPGTMSNARHESVSMYVSTCVALAIGAFLQFAAWWVFDYFGNDGSSPLGAGVVSVIAYGAILLSAAAGTCLSYAGGGMAIVKGWASARSHIDAMLIYIVHMGALASIVLSALVFEGILFTPAGMIVGLASAHLGVVCLSCGVVAAWIEQWTRVGRPGIGQALSVFILMSMACVGVACYIKIDIAYWNRGMGAWDLTPGQMAWRLNVMAPIAGCQWVVIAWSHWIMARTTIRTGSRLKADSTDRATRA